MMLKIDSDIDFITIAHTSQLTHLHNRHICTDSNDFRRHNGLNYFKRSPRMTVTIAIVKSQILVCSVF